MPRNERFLESLTFSLDTLALVFEYIMAQTSDGRCGDGCSHINFCGSEHCCELGDTTVIIACVKGL